MWKKVVGILSCAAMFLILGGVVLNFMGPSEEEIVHAEKVIEASFTGENLDDVLNMTDFELDDLRFYTPEGLTEADVQDLIHEMSHQKVKASEKWGSVVITQKRIARLIDIVEGNRNHYSNSEIYLDILNRWLVGDFSQADKDHNEIWSMNGGTIGKATGLLTPVEEQKYLQVNAEKERVTE